jgi:hypothetical protein
MKWRILLNLPSYPMAKQSQIIMACIALHNFIRQNAMTDRTLICATVMKSMFQCLSHHPLMQIQLLHDTSMKIKI